MTKSPLRLSSRPIPLTIFSNVIFFCSNGCSRGSAGTLRQCKCLLRSSSFRTSIALLGHLQPLLRVIVVLLVPPSLCAPAGFDAMFCYFQDVFPKLMCMCLSGLFVGSLPVVGFINLKLDAPCVFVLRKTSQRSLLQYCTEELWAVEIVTKLMTLGLPLASAKTSIRIVQLIICQRADGQLQCSAYVRMLASVLKGFKEH